jgi:type III pantothenate kinase
LSNAAFGVIDLGNTSIALGAWDAMRVTDSVRLPTEDRERFADAFAELCTRFPTGKPGVVAIASVVPAALKWIKEHLASDGEVKTVVIGQDTALPMPVAVREPDRVGTDRVCAAAAAFERIGRTCTVIDFGTAITVDLVDDTGTFVGGAILPGALLQSRALASGTAALPEVTPVAPQDAVGRDTAEAICSGIHYGIPGAVRGIVEQYATQLNQWPQVVATGGELPLLLDRCDFIDTPVPDLTLLGVGLAYVKHRQTAKQP